jgi:hypothetical protein
MYAPRAERVPVATDGWVRRVGERGGQLLFPTLKPLRVLDLSVTGAFIEGVPSLAVGGWVELFVRLPDEGEALALKGRVVRVDLEREGGCGVRFASIPAAHEKRIRGLR